MGCSLDVVAGTEILLHVKPVRDRKLLVANDRRGEHWGRELVIPLPDAAWQGGISVTLHCHAEGVEIGVEDLPPQSFTRCGDLRDPALRFKHAAWVKDRAEGRGDEAATARPADAAPPAAGAAQDRKALQEHVRRAEWAQVIALGTAYQQRHGRDAEVAAWIGRAHVSLGQHEQALAELDWLPREAPQQLEGMFYLGTALARLQRFDSAREILLGCVAERGREAKYVFELARATARLVNGGYGVVPQRPDLLDEAIELMSRAAALMPRDGRPHRDLGGLLLQKNLLPEALEALDEAQRRSPKLSMLAVERARILVRLDRIEEALHHARQAQAEDPANDTAASMVRVLERWLAGRQAGPFRVGLFPAVAGGMAAP
ncbi:lipopolysaccharide assembly protein LapB [Pseudoroseomonas cervicalis]|uniref:tetratricopeptide repeat protein n=1 Tax=Teichococcus cervicalis TaxID=204525 RepID=UPI0027D7FFB4|nr:tetratricopeptide repeat protein [Pseudoroseomonas cervicalis]